MYPIVHVGPYIFYTFGIMVGLGIALAYLAVSRYYELHNLRVNVALFFAIVIPFGFLFAKVDDAALNQAGSIHQLARDPLALIARGGYTYFGGLLSAVAAWMVLIRIYRLPFLQTLDGLFCVGLAFGIGRIGCFLSGDGDYGVPSNLPWAVSFPHGTVPTLVRVHPTMLYTTVWELTLFTILWRLSNPQRNPPLRPGTLLGLYLIFSGLGRFLVEFLSLNRVVAFGLKEAQMVSLALIPAGITTLVVVYRTTATSDVRSA